MTEHFDLHAEDGSEDLGNERTQGLLVDTRVLNKPGRYGGEEDKWRNWKFVMENYLSVLDEEYERELLAAGESTVEIVPHNGWTTARRRRDRTLYAILA